MKKEKKNLTASHPSMKGQIPQECWIGVTGDHRRRTCCPEPSFRLWSALPVTGVLAISGVVKNRYVYGVSQTPTQLLGRQMFRTPICKRTRHLNLPPKLCSNSIFNPQPAEVGGAHQWTFNPHSWTVIDHRHQDSLQCERMGKALGQSQSGFGKMKKDLRLTIWSHQSTPLARTLTSRL